MNRGRLLRILPSLPLCRPYGDRRSPRHRGGACSRLAVGRNPGATQARYRWKAVVTATTLTTSLDSR
jgi:hypothetical protein